MFVKKVGCIIIDVCSCDPVHRLQEIKVTDHCRRGRATRGLLRKSALTQFNFIITILVDLIGFCSASRPDSGRRLRDSVSRHLWVFGVGCKSASI